MRIGTATIENPVFLAPMAGVTDRAFRRICRQFGCGMVYTEMVSAKGIYYQDRKTESLMRIDPEEQPAAVQIFGSDPEVVGETVKKAEVSGALLIDLNMGCPAPKIVNNGDGSALMKNPELAGKIVAAAVKNTKLPVTVKIRKGWDSETAVEFAKILEENGAAAITVHGRTREQFYSGTADWGVIRRVKENVSVPVIGNGDIFKAADAERMLSETGCDGIMVARGAQGNPFLFRQIQEQLLKGEVTYHPDERERLTVALAHIRGIAEDKGERIGMKEARKHMAWYMKGMRGSAAYKSRIFAMTTYAELETLIREYLG